MTKDQGGLRGAFRQVDRELKMITLVGLAFSSVSIPLGLIFGPVGFLIGLIIFSFPLVLALFGITWLLIEFFDQLRRPLTATVAVEKVKL
jgi:uncharacterized membrane protein